MIANLPVPPSGTGPSPGPEGRFSILLVDDDEFILQAVGLLLSHMGYTPVFAATGEQALLELKAGLRPILVILDMDMPGMGGACTLPLIRSLRPELPIVIATGRPDRKVLELSQCFSGVSVMPKPYGWAEIQKRLTSRV